MPKTIRNISHLRPLLLLMSLSIILIHCDGCGGSTSPGESVIKPDAANISGCWHEILNPVSEFFCVDLCFRKDGESFVQVMVSPVGVEYRYEYFNVLDWADAVGRFTETTLEARGTFIIASDTLIRTFDYPLPLVPDTTDAFLARGEIAFQSEDTLRFAAHLYVRADSTRFCSDFWETFEVIPDGGGGGGGDWDWD